MIPTPDLTKRQSKILQEILTEWTTTPTLDNLMSKWEKRRQRTDRMLNIKCELSFMMLNVSSLKLYLNELMELLNELHFSILVLNGTRDDENARRVLSKHLSNYHIFFQKGTNAFGGVLIATHKSITVQRVKCFQSDLNLIVLDIGSGQDLFQLATCYSPPKENLPLSRFDDILARNSKTIILGDLNAKHKTWSQSMENQKGTNLHAWLLEKDVRVINKFIPTSTRSNAVIDLILVTSNMPSGSFAVLPPIGSDHLPIKWTSGITCPSKERHIPIKRTYWPLYERFLTFTFNYWNKLDESMPDKIVFFSLYERFLSLFAARLTYVSYSNAYRPSLPPQVVALIQDKRRYLSLARKTKHPYYITQLKLHSLIVQRAMTAYKRHAWSEYCRTLNTCDTKQFWRKSRRHFSAHSPPIDGLVYMDKTITAPKEMCRIAEMFYADQFAEHANTYSNLEAEADAVNDELEDQIRNSTPAPVYTRVAKVKKIILSMKNKNSTGIDGVSNRMIKLLPSSHIALITTALNYMSNTARVPPHWRRAKMILLPKAKSAVVDIGDTRPISLLPCFSKLYEKIFLTHLRQWINDNGILPEEQTGFRPGHNMSTRIVAIIDQIGQGLAVNTATAALFIDFKAAFNQLWFKGLWVKLKRLNCPLHLIAWLRNYLSHRSAQIEIKGETSNGFNLFKGVPQGSCVGPVLFTIFHYDILNAVANVHHKHLFADDLAIVIAPSPTWSSKMLIPHLSEIITDVLKALQVYAEKWKQAINFLKTYWTLFHRQISPSIPPVCLENGTIIEQTTKIKYLGTTLDSRLSFSSHIDNIKSKIYKNLIIFKRLARSRMLSQEISYRLYHAYIRPHLQSILSIYPVLSRTKQQQLEALNRQIFRVVHRWFDARNDEIINLPTYKSIEKLSQNYFTKLLSTITQTNPNVMAEFIQHKMYLLYLNQYLTDPTLIKEKRRTMVRGRTPNRVRRLLTAIRPTLFDIAFGFVS
jgi:hypothetical protein